LHVVFEDKKKADMMTKKTESAEKRKLREAVDAEIRKADQKTKTEMAIHPDIAAKLRKDVEAAILADQARADAQPKVQWNPRLALLDAKRSGVVDKSTGKAAPRGHNPNGKRKKAKRDQKNQSSTVH
jgi:hypothetical protein